MMKNVMKNFLSRIFVFGMIFVMMGAFQQASAQTITPSPTPTSAVQPSSTPTPTVVSSPTPTSTASSTTKGGVGTSSTTLPDELPVTGAYDSLVFMIVGGLILIGLAGVIRTKLLETIEE